jgi:hypothetical protein
VRRRGEDMAAAGVKKGEGKYRRGEGCHGRGRRENEKLLLWCFACMRKRGEEGETPPAGERRGNEGLPTGACVRE